MTRLGNCWDNAPQESFFGHMKDHVVPSMTCLFKYFLDMTPKDLVINPSSLTKFRKLRHEQLQLTTDTKARIGHKTAHSSFFGFKEYISTNDERIITAAVITTGEKIDGETTSNID
jgi:transposase InsO family protein